MVLIFIFTDICEDMAVLKIGFSPEKVSALQNRLPVR